jgi:hypothetical protein
LAEPGAGSLWLLFQVIYSKKLQTNLLFQGLLQESQEPLSERRIPEESKPTLFSMQSTGSIKAFQDQDL